MRERGVVACCLLLAVSTSTALAGNDGNRQLSVSTDLVALSTLLADPQASPTLSSLSDAQLHAKIDQATANVTAIRAELAKRKKRQLASTASSAGAGNSSPPPGKTNSASSTTNPAAYYQKQYKQQIDYHSETPIVSPKPANPSPCDPQRFFIRANSLDTYLYGITPSNKAQGASISYTDDRLAGTQSATINGMVSYVVSRDLCSLPTPAGDAPFLSGYSIAPFVLGQGNYTEPHAKTEHSELKFGLDNEFEISRGLFPRQVFTITPYAATDYRGEAQIFGGSAYLDLYDPNLHLGGYVVNDPYLGWFLQVRGETDWRDVSAVGVTNLTKTDYAWFGASAQLNMFFFPSATNVPDYIQNRFAFYATAKYFDDANSGKQARQYTLKLAYKIPPDGSSSIAAEYDDGTDKDTLVRERQYLLSLTYAY